MFALYFPALVVAFLITVLEMTEVVALVFALSADHTTIRHSSLGAVTGTAVVAAAALGFGALLLAFPRTDLLWASAVVLTGFGAFLFRSTVRSYRRSTSPPTGPSLAPSPQASAAQFAGGFSAGAIESTEAVVVLLALAAAGYGPSALVGAVVGGVVLVTAAALVHERIRRVKAPWLKLGATSMLFTFAVFWGGEAASYSWPGDDLILVPLFVAALLVVRGAVELGLRRTAASPETT